MPSDNTRANGLTGRCYCGAFSLSAARAPKITAYCHCADCRRWTGSPLPAFAAFAPDDLAFEPPLDQGRSFAPGVTRWVCTECGSPLAAVFDYLPDQIYVPVGVIDQIDEVTPQLHCHSQSRASWLRMADGLPCHDGSARDALSES